MNPAIYKLFHKFLTDFWNWISAVQSCYSFASPEYWLLSSYCNGKSWASVRSEVFKFCFSKYVGQFTSRIDAMESLCFNLSYFTCVRLSFVNTTPIVELFLIVKTNSPSANTIGYSRNLFHLFICASIFCGLVIICAITYLLVFFQVWLYCTHGYIYKIVYIHGYMWLSWIMCIDQLYSAYCFFDLSINICTSSLA